jgi:uncharacterized membrane protein
MISCSLTTGLVSVLSTAIGVTVIGGSYLTLRNADITTSALGSLLAPATTNTTATAAPSYREMPPAQQTIDDTVESSSPPSHTASVLDLLPDDERRILKPVLASPGLTQIELRDRSDFSKAKVSQTVTDLEKRGLLYRERQGRTYRVYPADSLETQLNH